MYTKALREKVWLKSYQEFKGLLSSKYILNHLILTCLKGFLRFQYPLEYNGPVVRARFPGPKQQEALESQTLTLDNQYQVFTLSHSHMFMH